MSKNYFHENQKLVNGNKVDVTLFFEAVFDPTKDAKDKEAIAFRQAVGTLAIPTGADEITWGYGLNTKRIPTYGGEVVQVLSMYSDKMTIKGTCRTYNELNTIYEFFKNYIAYTTGAKGLDTQRHQKFLRFRYPARGWSFVIMVNDISDMRMSKDIAAPVWALTAEIVSENDRYALGSNRLDKWASVLDQPVVQNRMTRSGAIQGPKNFKLVRDGDPFGDLVDPMGRRGKIAENFDALVASWATGDIKTLHNNPLVSPEKSADEIWSQNFGDYSGSAAAGVSGGGGTVSGSTPTGSSFGNLGNLGAPLQAEVVAALAASAFEKHGYKAAATDKNKLTVAVAIAAAESGFVSRAINYNGIGANSRNYTTYISKYLNEVPKENSNYDLGIWQINNYWNVENILRETGTTYDASASYDDKRKVMASSGACKKVMDDPFSCAMMMASASNGGVNWGTKTGGWTTYDNGSYRSHMAEAAKAVSNYLANPGQYSGTIESGGGGGFVTGDIPSGALYQWPVNPRGTFGGGPWGGTHDGVQGPSNWESAHAVDFMVDENSDVIAVADGVVTDIGGNYVDGGGQTEGLWIYLSTDGNEFFYQHNKKLYVKKGAKVKRGQIIARSGLGGGSAHLHLGMKSPINYYDSFGIKPRRSDEWPSSIKKETTNGLGQKLKGIK